MTDTPRIEHFGNGMVRFLFGDREAGTYHAADDHKPYLNPLYTPNGYKVSLGRPHDHPHHKGLMFSLQTDSVNYWEEHQLAAGSGVGVQEPLGPPDVSIDGESIICRQKLAWHAEGESEIQISEDRVLKCMYLPDQDAFSWNWQSELVPEQTIQLVKSPYSPALPDGTLVNYHGLGIRFRREFGCTGGNSVSVDGEVLPIADALGKQARKVTFTGSIDEIWPVSRCQVSFQSPNPWGVFVMDAPFAYLAFGPSVLEKPVWERGTVQRLEFTVDVADIPESESGG